VRRLAAAAAAAFVGASTALFPSASPSAIGIAVAGAALVLALRRFAAGTVPSMRSAPQ